jgi:hypothetical protein
MDGQNAINSLPYQQSDITSWEKKASHKATLVLSFFVKVNEGYYDEANPRAVCFIW